MKCPVCNGLGELDPNAPRGYSSEPCPHCDKTGEIPKNTWWKCYKNEFGKFTKNEIVLKFVFDIDENMYVWEDSQSCILYIEEVMPFCRMKEVE